MFDFTGKNWVHYVPVIDKNGDESIREVPVKVTDVPVERLLIEWEKLVVELSDKEVELAGKKEDYNRKEFEIVFQSDIDFKGLYGSTSEKVRKQHAKTVLSKLDNEINSLELSINWIKQYIPLLREVIKTKRSE